jgi:hypothetical protein
VSRLRRLIATTVALLLSGSGIGAASGGGSGFGIVISISGGGPIPIAYRSLTVPARISGALIVRFRGDRAAGCERRGVCGSSGTIVWTPAHPAGLEIDGLATRKGTGYSVDLGIDQQNPVGNGGGTTDADTDEAGSACADAATTGGDLSFPVVRKSVHISLVGGGLLTTRCGGPLDTDLGQALPETTLPLPELARGSRTIELRGDRQFASHGLAGTVTSTLSISLGIPGRWHHARLKIHRSREREVSLDYRATLGGQLVADVSGDADQGLCGPLGACGLSGTLSFQLPAVGRAEFTVDGPVKYSYAELLRALHRRQALKGVFVFGDLEWRRGARMVANMQTPGGSCRDDVGAGPAAVEVSIGRRELRSQLDFEQEFESALRTRCPGPFLPQQSFASGRAPASILGRQTATIPINSGPRFSDDGYHGRFVSTLAITLSHLTIKRRTVTGISESG